jgi:lantibiotic modifying enzyme
LSSGLVPACHSDSLAANQGLEATKALAGIFAQICETAVPGRNNSASWRVREEGSSPAKWIGPHLYDGSCGVALFLGAYYLVTHDERAHRLALQAIQQLRAKIASLAEMPNHSRPQNLAIGGFVGLGGFLYTFVQLAFWLDEPPLMQSVIQTVSLITSDGILNDVMLDVVGGCAGTLLALLKFLSAGHQESSCAMELALSCGKRLLDRRIAYNGGPRAWPGSDFPPLCGFAHGASGIAYALLQLFKYTNRQEFLEAALEGFAFERKLFDASARSWLDLRFNRPHEQNAWCHGAPGVALARLGMVAVIGDPVVYRDLEDALAITTGLPESTRDHLCCGNFGLIEILHTAGHILGNPELIVLANKLVQQALIRARDGGFSFSSISTNENCIQFQPSLLRGVSGVGYALMRLIHPNTLPCVLMLA